MRPFHSLLLAVPLLLLTVGSSCETTEFEEGRPCTRFSDCDDGLYCTGVEVCAGPAGGEKRCRYFPPPCAGSLVCVEETEECLTECESNPDADGDGHDSITCGGGDCDDADPVRSPGRPEICDGADVDEDCDPSTFGERDADGDGHVDARCANGDPEAEDRVTGDDCNDAAAGTHPDAPEVCNAVDDDCDGAIDEGVSFPLYEDADHDGFGTGTPIQGCPGASSRTAHDGDCDDANPELSPGTIRCGVGGQGNDYQLCQPDGTWANGVCPQARVCVAQPGGAGICTNP